MTASETPAPGAVLMKLLDNLAVENGGPQTIHGQDYIRIRREDWDALLALRGTDDEILARMEPFVEPADRTAPDLAGFNAACRWVGLS